MFFTYLKGRDCPSADSVTICHKSQDKAWPMPGTQGPQEPGRGLANARDQMPMRDSMRRGQRQGSNAHERQDEARPESGTKFPQETVWSEAKARDQMPEEPGWGQAKAKDCIQFLQISGSKPGSWIIHTCHAGTLTGNWVVIRTLSQELCYRIGHPTLFFSLLGSSVHHLESIINCSFT